MTDSHQTLPDAHTNSPPSRGYQRAKNILVTTRESG